MFEIFSTMCCFFRYNRRGENWVISREIHKNNNSTWSVNGRPATMKSVYNIASFSNILIIYFNF